MKTLAIFFLTMTFVFSTAFASEATLTKLTEDAVSHDVERSTMAVLQLRAMGQKGLDALFARYGANIEKFRLNGRADPEMRRIAYALDAVAMQKDAYASQLYWYTDLEKAKLAAKAEKKPILTLRLLGNLNEEFSCANSRLFRSVLYPNADVSKTLRENYILHWQSVRPAPRITIDFGDGRKIERTITGNSIHYILDQNGTLIDALPGLYSPLAFRRYLGQAVEVNREINQLPDNRRPLALMKYRKSNFDRIVHDRGHAITTSGVELVETRTGTPAILAAPVAMTKMVVVDEYSILRMYDDFAKFEPTIKFDYWNKLAKVYSPEQNVDPNTVAMMRRQNAGTGRTDDEFSALLARLEAFIALDTTRNEFIFHAKLYEWLNEARGAVDLEELNSRVYDKLFQTPNTDKWLGLYSADVYTALDGNGVTDR